MKEYLISGRNISVTYGKRSILRSVAVNVGAGEIITIIGPNGSGKTTLLKILCGLQQADSGDVEIKNSLIIGYMPQKLQIERVLPLTVRRFLRLNGNNKHLRSIDEVEKIAAEFRISHLLKEQVHDISGGEMQRVMLARAVLRNPQLLVLDEPTQGLDINGQAEFYQLVADLRNKTGCAVLMVSHDLNMVMASTDRVICINGHICCEGAPEDINSHPEYLALFGKNAANTVSIYTHNHDHTHCMDGHVKGECRHDN